MQDFGLERANLVRNSLFLLKFDEQQTQTFAECGESQVRGVVGPRTQIAAMHSNLSSNEQIRLFTLWAPKSPKGPASEEWGIVMLHAQVWTHNKQSPEVMLRESSKWKLLSEPFAAWAYAEAAYRIMQANPYVTYKSSTEAVKAAEQALLERPKVNELQTRFSQENFPWTLADYAVVYQTKGVEMALKLRMAHPEENVNEQIARCKQAGRLFAAQYAELIRRFNGFECMPYKPNEALDNPPQAGTQFYSWESLSKSDN